MHNIAIKNMEKKIEALRSYLNGLKIERLDICNYLYKDYEVETIIKSDNPFDKLLETIDENGIFNDIYVMYCNDAMDYLKDNDPSLQESLGLAHDLGYTAENLNSELLASLLAADIARNELNDKETAINDFIESLNENSDGLGIM
jgi:Asp-tRNA(Asn)/Glu-tRNA(Gln) amidotransferase B subunit